MSTCSFFTLGVIFLWGYVAFALKSGRVYGNGLRPPTYRADSPFSYWFMVLMLTGAALFFSYLRFDCA
jgi:hypothetical protein